MNFKEEILNFLKSDDTEYYMKENYNSFYLYKIPLAKDNGYAIYKMKTNFKNMEFNKFQYMFSVNEKNELIHISEKFVEQSNYYYYDRLINSHDMSKVLDKEITEEDIYKCNKPFENFQEDVKNIMHNFVSKYHENYDKEYKYEDYKDKVIDIYKDQKKFKDPIDELNIVLDTESLSYYLTDDFEDFICSNIDKEIIEDYKTYYMLKKGLVDYENELNADPVLRKNKQIIDILLDDSFKSFRIYHTLPNGNEEEFKFKKGTKKYGDVNKDIMERNVIYNIPIEAINKIIFRKDVLYEMPDDFKYDYKQLAIGYTRAICDRRSKDIFEVFNDDKDVMFELLKNNCPKASYYYYYPGIVDLYRDLDDELKKDADFIDKVLDTYNNRMYSFLKSLHPDTYNDVTFVNMIAKHIHKFDDYNIKDYIDLLSPSVKTSELLEKLILFKLQEDKDEITRAITDMMKKFDPNLISEPSILKIIQSKPFSKYAQQDVVAMMDNKETLLKLLNVDEISPHFCYLNKELLKDREFVKSLLKDPNVDPMNNVDYSYYRSHLASFSPDFKDLYADDSEIKYLVASKIKEGNTEEFIKVFNIDKADKSEMFTLASLSTAFLQYLDANEQDLFFDNESASISGFFVETEKIDDENEKNTFIFTTEYGEFRLSLDTFIYKTNNENPESCYYTIASANPDIKNHVYQNLADFIKTEYNIEVSPNAALVNDLIGSSLKEVPTKDELER